VYDGRLRLISEKKSQLVTNKSDSSTRDTTDDISNKHENTGDNALYEFEETIDSIQDVV
jgi:hypothetical protein